MIKKILSEQSDKSMGSNQELRLLAEKKIRKKTSRFSESLSGLSPVEIKSLIHELNVYHVELEIQNEELRRTELELDASRNRYFELYELAPVAYITLSEEGKILEANLQASILLEVGTGALLNQFFSNFILKEDLNIYYHNKSQILESFSPVDYEIRMIKKNNTEFMANLELRAVHDHQGKITFRIIIIDITESKKQQKEEREIFLNLSIDMIAMSDKNGNFKEVNQAFKKTSGFSNEELISKALTEFIHPDDIKLTLSAIEKLAEGSPTVSFTNRFRCSDGSYKWLESSMTTVGDIRYSISRDITERRQTVENMAVALEKEREINYLKSKFVSMVSHQFKTPLTVIQSNFELINMYKGMINDSFKGKFGIISERIIKETKKLNDLLNDILSLSVINSGKPQVSIQNIDLISLIREVTSEVNHIQNDRRVIDLFIPVSHKIISTDPKLISHILLNVLTNAFKFSKDCKNPELKLELAGNKIIIGIKDFGIGIPLEAIQHVSEAFFRANNTEDIEGTGLGLNIAKEYLQLLNGSILIESTEKKFTLVKIILPLK